jgi:hypothetical protein
MAKIIRMYQAKKQESPILEMLNEFRLKSFERTLKKYSDKNKQTLLNCKKTPTP